MKSLLVALLLLAAGNVHAALEYRTIQITHSTTTVNPSCLRFEDNFVAPGFVAPICAAFWDTEALESGFLNSGLRQFTYLDVTAFYNGGNCENKNSFYTFYLGSIYFESMTGTGMNKTYTAEVTYLCDPALIPSATATETATPVFSATLTPSPTRTITETRTVTPTRTISPTRTATRTSTRTPAASATVTPTFTATRTRTPTFTKTVTRTVTPTPTVTPTFTRTVTPTFTETP